MKLEKLNAVSSEFQISDTVVSSDKLSGGILNKTYLIKTSSNHKYILQKISPSLNPEKTSDIFAVTSHLYFRGWNVAVPLKSIDGSTHIDFKGKFYRAFPYIDNDGKKEVKKEWVSSIGKMLRLFHVDMSSFEGDIKIKIDGFHDTKRIMNELKSISFYDKRFYFLSDKILNVYLKLVDRDIFSKNIQIIHGDTRYQNILFYKNKPVTMVDFDTVMSGSIYIDISDLIRSIMCDENQESSIYCEEVIDWFVEGYDSSGLNKKDVKNSLVIMSLELSARFLIDCHNDNYFGWDCNRFKSRIDYNYVRSQAQLFLAESCNESM